MAGASRFVFVGAVDSDARGGVTVRNKLIVEELKRQGVKVRLLDTGTTGRRDRARQLLELLGLLPRENQFLVSVASRGTYVLVVLLAVASLLRPKLRAAMLVVGRELPNNISRLRGASRVVYEWCLSRYDRFYVQGTWIRNELEELGLRNVRVLPNPRRKSAESWCQKSLESRSLVFVSRVMKEKGIELAMAAVEHLRASGSQVGLEVYGPIDDSYSARFEALLSTRPGTSYQGVLDADLVPRVLTSHSALLLPTTFATEGTPGVLVEAGMSGVPVIVSDVPAVRELIRDGCTGLLLRTGDPAELASRIDWLLTHPSEAEQLGKNLRTSLQSHELSRVVIRLREDLKEVGWA